MDGEKFTVLTLTKKMGSYTNLRHRSLHDKEVIGDTEAMT